MNLEIKRRSRKNTKNRPFRFFKKSEIIWVVGWSLALHKLITMLGHPAYIKALDRLMIPSPRLISPYPVLQALNTANLLPNLRL